MLSVCTVPTEGQKSWKEKEIETSLCVSKAKCHVKKRTIDSDKKKQETLVKLFISHLCHRHKPYFIYFKIIRFLVLFIIFNYSLKNLKYISINRSKRETKQIR